MSKNQEYGNALSDLLASLGMIENYISLLTVSHEKKFDHESLTGLHLSLFNDKTLSNMNDILQIACEKIDDIAGELIYEEEDSNE